MDYIDLLTPEANKKPRACCNALPPPAPVAVSSLVDLTTDLLVSFCCINDNDNDHRGVDARHDYDRRPGLPRLPGADCSFSTDRAYSLTHSSPRRKIPRPFLDTQSIDKKNLDPCCGSNVLGFKMPLSSDIDPASLATSHPTSHQCSSGVEGAPPRPVALPVQTTWQGQH